jgi:eukaryotic-like serine/threonine-protein kinase
MIAVPPARRTSPVDCIERTMLDEHARGYQVVREIGRGGMGVVFLARDVMLHRLVAIKVLRYDLAGLEEQRERFRREARVTARLSDDGIVAVHGFGETGDLVYIVMEYVRGAALGSLLSALGKIEPDAVRGILASLARTLDHAHARGIVHRDLKPENILLEQESGRPLLTDFGVALSRSIDPLPSEAARAFGTPHFMSPEQAAGELDLDGRSDLYSLGVLGYLMLTGEVPFDGANFAAIASKHIAEAHVPIHARAPKAPKDLVVAIEKCLAKDRDSRWRRAGDFADALLGKQNRSSGMELVSQLGRFAAMCAVALGLSGGQ